MIRENTASSCVDIGIYGSDVDTIFKKKETALVCGGVGERVMIGKWLLLFALMFWELEQLYIV